MTSAKYNKVRDVSKSHDCVFGIIEKETGKTLCVSSSLGGTRNISASKPLIIKPIRFIMNNFWGAYMTITECLWFVHTTMCVNPTNLLVDIQTVDRFWIDIKDKIKGSGHGRIIEHIYVFVFTKVLRWLIPLFNYWVWEILPMKKKITRHNKLFFVCVRLCVSLVGK